MYHLLGILVAPSASYLGCILKESVKFLTAVRMFLPSPGLAPWEGMNFCLCSWLCVLSVSRCVDLPFWPSQSAHLSSALYDHNDQKLSSWAQSKVSTVQAITKGALVLLFNKAKTALQVFGRSCIEDTLTSFQQTAFFSITFWFVLLGALSSRVFQAQSIFFFFWV